MKTIVPSTSQVLVFKSGIVKVVKNFTLSSEDTCVLIPNPPYALRGSFWVHLRHPVTESDDGLTDCNIRSIRVVANPQKLAREEEAVPQQVPCSNWREIVEANAGTLVSISRHQGGVVGGKILDVGQEFVVLRRLDAARPFVTTVVNFSQIVDMSGFSDAPLKITREETPTEVLRRLAFSQKEEEVTSYSMIEYRIARDCVAELSYLTKDMKWQPSYSLHLDYESRKATLKMQAMILMEGASEKDSDSASGSENVEGEEEGESRSTHGAVIKKLFLAGGTPELHMENSPEQLLEVGGSKFPGGGGGRRRRRRDSFDGPDRPRRALSCAMPMEPIMLQAGDAQGMVGQEEFVGQGQDWVAYQLDDVPVAPRICLPVFTLADLNFIEVYMVDLVVSKEPLPVRHVARIGNSSLISWTKAPVITTSTNQLLVGQSFLAFTPPGRKGDVQLDSSLSVRVSYGTTVLSSEEERSCLEGIASIENTRRVDVVVLLTQTLEGKLKTSEPEPFSKSEKVGYKNRTTSAVVWRIEIAARSRCELKLTYETNKLFLD